MTALSRPPLLLIAGAGLSFSLMLLALLPFVSVATPYALVEDWQNHRSLLLSSGPPGSSRLPRLLAAPNRRIPFTMVGLIASMMIEPAVSRLSWQSGSSRNTPLSGRGLRAFDDRDADPLAKRGSLQANAVRPCRSLQRRVISQHLRNQTVPQQLLSTAKLQFIKGGDPHGLEPHL
jgi:hypothetical protein